MKYLKMLGLAAVAAATLMAFAGAGSASATGVLCSTTVSPCPLAQVLPAGTAFDFSLAGPQIATFETTSGSAFNSCAESTIRGTFSSNGIGEATSTNKEITWGMCSRSVATIKLGKLKINNIAGTSNGTVIADEEITVTISGLFSGEHCIYGAAASSSLGTLTEGNPAIFNVNAALTKSEKPGDECLFGPNTMKVTAIYQLTEPNPTTLSVSSS